MKLIDVSLVEKWIRDYVASCGVNGIAIGISGGIDSAVVAGLSVNAIGHDKVLGLILPCESHINDTTDGAMVCDHLNIKYHVVDSSLEYREIIDSMRRATMTEPGLLTRANIKSRLRMILTMGFCNQFNLLNAGTTNKSEFMIGYFTKYGDGGVDIEPIADFYKTEIFEMAKLLGVPQKIIDRKPSAGLWEGQTDEGEIGMSYDDLDGILKLLSINLPEYQIEVDPNNEDAYAKFKLVLEMVRKSEHKKHMPPSYRR